MAILSAGNAMVSFLSGCEGLESSRKADGEARAIDFDHDTHSDSCTISTAFLQLPSLG